MKKNKIFIACDTTSIKKVKNIIKNTQTNKLKVGYKFGLEFLNSKNGRIFIKKLNKQITPKEIIKARKEFRTSVIVRNIYSEVLNIIQAATMNKLSQKKYNKEGKKFLNDALMTSIAGISAAMKNTG